MRATLIAGLPGSGKSTLARQLASEVSGAVVLDDPDTIDALDQIAVTTPLAVVTHPAFCEANARARVERELLLRHPDVDVRWIFFANDPAACRLNILQRADGRAVMGYVSALTQRYEIPPSADVRPVFVMDPKEDTVSDPPVVRL